MTPNFSAFPWHRLPRLGRREAALQTLLARWLAAHPRAERLAKLVASSRATTRELARVRAAIVPAGRFDPFAACCDVRVGGALIEVRGASAGVRAIAQRVLYGPDELAAPRPLTLVERAIWSLVVATALEDLDVRGEVSPVLDADKRSGGPDHVVRRADAIVGRADAIVGRADAIVGRADAIVGRADNPQRPHAGQADGPRTVVQRPRRGHAEVGRVEDDGEAIVELAVELGDIDLAVQIVVPPTLELRVPPARPPALELSFDVPIVVGRCALPGSALGDLAVRSLITLEGCCELEILGGVVGLRAPAGAVVAEVATGYVRRDMSLPDEAHVEVTVSLGTTRLTLRQVCDLAVGQIIQLGRPLAGPFDIRAEGRLVGRGELVDVDGELAVRIVSLGDQE